MGDRIKILYTMPGEVAGGGHLGTLEIMDGVRRFGFVPIALVNHKQSEIVSLLKSQNLDYIYLRGNPGLTRKEFVRFLSQVFLIRKTILDNNISLLHFSELDTGHYGILAAKLARRPSILHIKNLHWTMNYGWPNKVVLSQASRILTISNAVGKAALTVGFPISKVTTVYDGVEVGRFELKKNSREKVRNKLHLSHDKFTVGFVGRLGVHWKNEPLVYRVLGELSRESEQIVLLVVGGPGDGKDETFHRSKILAKELGESADIRFLGTSKNIPEILSAMDTLLVPSKEEALGRVVMEGMASALPVVGSKVGGIPEMITDGQDGFLRPPDDLKGWIEIVKTLFEDKDLRRRIGKNARKTVEERFTLEGMIERVAREYLRLLKTKRTNQNAN